MRGVLRAEPLWVETFTGLRMTQFARLLKVVRERGWRSTTARSSPCDSSRRCSGSHAATVCRVIQRLGPLLANVRVIIDADTRLVVATARPAPGNKADAQVWRGSGLHPSSPGPLHRSTRREVPVPQQRSETTCAPRGPSV